MDRMSPEMIAQLDQVRTELGEREGRFFTRRDLLRRAWADWFWAYEEIGAHQDGTERIDQNGSGTVLTARAGGAVEVG
jgi:hypothetical protein